MKEEFDGVKYFILDSRPIKTVWEAGIITETYEVSRRTSEITRNDMLGHYVSCDLTSNDEISFENYRGLVKALMI